MKVYFTASLHGKDKFEKDYQVVVDSLEKLGHKTHSDQILKNSSRSVKAETPEQTAEVYQKLSKLLKSSDIIVAEISYPSVSVGHEISLGLELNKPVIALYTGDANPHQYLMGIPNDNLQVFKYNQEDVEKIVKDAIGVAVDQSDVRFNFFITPQLLSYLDWIAGKKRVPRSVHIRKLIEKDMNENKEFQED